jgi:hypothetical protein
MRIFSSMRLLVAGTFAGVLPIASCGDDSSGRVDAGTCDCPAAEPPLAGRITIASATATIPANSRGLQGTGCPEGSLRLTGSCTTDPPNPIRNVTLEQSGFFYENDLRGWSCFFKNKEATPVTIKVTLVCLMPAS